MANQTNMDKIPVFRHNTFKADGYPRNDLIFRIGCILSGFWRFNGQESEPVDPIKKIQGFSVTGNGIDIKS